MARKRIKTKKQQSSWALGAIIAGAAILVIAAVLLLTQNNPQAETPVQQQADIPYPAVQRISLTDAKTAYDQGTAVFLDVRSASSYDTSHVPGALSIPLEELAVKIDQLNPQDWIITYCT